MKRWPGVLRTVSGPWSVLWTAGIICVLLALVSAQQQQPEHPSLWIIIPLLALFPFGLFSLLMWAVLSHTRERGTTCAAVAAGAIAGIAELGLYAKSVLAGPPAAYGAGHMAIFIYPVLVSVLFVVVFLSGLLISSCCAYVRGKNHERESGPATFDNWHDGNVTPD